MSDEGLRGSSQGEAGGCAELRLENLLIDGKRSALLTVSGQHRPARMAEVIPL